ncbi:arginase family protein [Mesorhizobium sp. M6A.T.Cr.TU.014.01.1.1]|nr:arginase family protein [Mesorhizobium sp. M6A.T.Cr.TU.014.01.1.1]RWQ02267.1 MAG: arginase family protein [Mesorhizobium sp.]RWQ09904.1 MAG: arginase family protein [Mesorhizobium sp.]
MIRKWSFDLAARLLNIIGAATSAGAYSPGQEQAPAAFRRHGLAEALVSRGRTIRDHGDVASFRWRPDPSQPQAMNLEAVRHACDLVASNVATAIAAQEDVLVLGGDCTVELGTVAGANAAGARIGLVYIDFDADLNTPDTSDGALDWTGVAHLLNISGCEPSLARLGPTRPMLVPQQLLYFGVENITPPEAATIRDNAIKVISREEALNDIEAAARAAEWAARFDCVLIHFDVDVLSFVDFPIAENVRRCDGLKLEQAAFVLKQLAALPQWRGLTITEVNPAHAPDETAAFARLNEVLADALG